MGATQPFDAHVIVRDNLTTTRTRPSAADRSRLLTYTIIITMIIATWSADNTARVCRTSILCIYLYIIKIQTIGHRRHPRRVGTATCVHRRQNICVYKTL
uniref:Uncharacterized protein n=1 Tax=Schizaphis graminum TaxID=13262 RepID=A0A2S2PKI8_SCHGA